MKRTLFLFYFVAILPIIGCNKQNLTNENACEKITTLEEALNLAADIRKNQLSSIESIEENLIGEWCLRGILPGWRAFDPIEDFIMLNIDEDSIFFNDLRSGITFKTPWSIVPFEVNNIERAYLKTNEEEWNNRIGMDVFSKNHMHGSGRVEDGNTYIYKKIN